MTRLANDPVRLPHRIRRILRRAAGLGLCSLMLSACDILPERETLSLYRPEPVVAADAMWPQVKWQLRIARPYADDLHDSARILVRPQPGELQVYKGAAWVQPAPDLVLDALLRAFADSGRVPGLARRGEGIDADYELLLDLRRFEADYVGSDGPVARIELGARLVHNADNRVAAARVFSANAAADGADAAAINRAFGNGLNELVPQIAAWTLGEGQRDGSRKKD